jgi:hypothetical protein
MSGKMYDLDRERADRAWTSILDAAERLRKPRRLVSITVDPEWPRRPFVVMADSPVHAGVEVIRSRWIQPGQMLLHYSDGTVEVVSDDDRTPPTNGGNQP